MKKFSKVLLASSLLTIAAASPAFAGGAKITGGAERINAGPIFSMTVNAIDTAKGVKGSIQYSREAQGSTPELFVHAKSECFWISEDGLRAVVAGPAEVQAGIQDDVWFFAAIREGGTGYGDLVRAGFISNAAGLLKCENGETSFPGLVEEGEFKIRPAE